MADPDPYTRGWHTAIQRIRDLMDEITDEHDRKVIEELHRRMLFEGVQIPDSPRHRFEAATGRVVCGWCGYTAGVWAGPRRYRCDRCGQAGPVDDAEFLDVLDKVWEPENPPENDPESAPHPLGELGRDGVA